MDEDQELLLDEQRGVVEKIQGTVEGGEEISWEIEISYDELKDALTILS